MSSATNSNDFFLYIINIGIYSGLQGKKKTEFQYTYFLSGIDVCQLRYERIFKVVVEGLVVVGGR